jgi:hypothetical protein
MRAALAFVFALFVCACSGPFGSDSIEDAIKERYKIAEGHPADGTAGGKPGPRLESVDCTPATLPLDGTRWNAAYDCVLVFEEGTRLENCFFSTESRKVDSRYRGRCTSVPGRG